ncbi:MAG: hypothetical protein E4G90_03060 [Gemmatimonadales bacterium]|nr:MAG: hypothetical protein E4G90_03060 [Gemmatimonadales bacterium]
MFSPDIPLDPEKTVEFFRDALAQNGWEAQESLDSRLNSFESGAVAVFCREEDISMMLEVALYRDGVTAVRMFIQESGAFRCHGQGWPRKVGALGVLPALTAPEGSTWESPQVFVARSGGGLDQPGLVKAAVTWSTGLDAKSAEEHFRNQLAQAGWVLKERGGGGPVAWSTWDVKDEPGGSWDGLLVVIRLPGGETSALFRLYPTAPVLAPTPARVPVPEDRAGLEELFGRFFQSEGQVQILPEALPPGFSITLPPGAKVVGSVVFAEEGFVAEGFVAEEAQTIEAQIIEAQIIIDVAMEPGEVEEFFQEELAETGWKSLQRSLPRGFVSAEGKPAGSTLFFTLCNDVENISMHFTTFPLEDGRSGVNIMYRNQTPSICDWPGPSAPSLPSLPTLPALKMPVGTKAQGSGSGEGGDNAHAEVTLVTDLSAVALEEHFAEQLADFAWARVAEGADGPTSWSVWQYEGSDGSP